MPRGLNRKGYPVNKLEELESRRLLTSVTFGPASDIAFGTKNAQIAGVVTADLTNDGFSDIVIANRTYNSVSILLGNGDGTFKPAETYRVGNQPYALAVADLNGDGKPDIIVADNQAGAVGILLNNGDGTFQPAIKVRGLSFPDSVAVGDVTGDGFPDIVVGENIGTGTVVVLPGNGDGTFRTPITLHVPNDVAALTLGDLDENGTLDIVTANRLQGSGGNVSVIMSNGNGTFKTPTTFSVDGSPDAVVVADLNNDSVPDIATLNLENSHNTISVLLGNGDGSFKAAQNYTGYNGSGATSLAVGDFSGDGIPDLVVGSSFILVGNGNGTFQTAEFQNTGGAFISAVGDFNGDGEPDLVTVNLNETAAVALNNSVGTFPSITYSAGTVFITGSPGEDTASVALTPTQLIATVDFTSKPFALASVKSLNIQMGAGNDSILLPAGAPAALADGQAGNDTLVDNSSANNTLIGGNGADSVRAGNGNDLLTGGKGRDTLIGGNGMDTLEGGNGDDSLKGGFSASMLYGNDGNDTLLSRSAGSILRGNAGNDLLRAPQGGDTLLGDPDNDTLVGTLDTAAPDLLTAGGGRNVYFYGPRDSLSGETSADTLSPLA